MEDDGGQQGLVRIITFKFLRPAPRPKELTGASDLLGHHGLRKHYEGICRHPPPESLASSGYLVGVVGGREVRVGGGMALGPLLQPPNTAALAACQVAELDPAALLAAFTFREATPAQLPESERGAPAEPEEQPAGAAAATAAAANGGGDRKRKHRDKDRERGKDGGRDAARESERHRHKGRRRENGGEQLANGEDERHKKSKRKREDVGKEVGEPPQAKATLA